MGGRDTSCTCAESCAMRIGVLAPSAGSRRKDISTVSEESRNMQSTLCDRRVVSANTQSTSCDRRAVMSAWQRSNPRGKIRCGSSTRIGRTTTCRSKPSGKSRRGSFTNIGRNALRVPRQLPRLFNPSVAPKTLLVQGMVEGRRCALHAPRLLPGPLPRLFQPLTLLLPDGPPWEMQRNVWQRRSRLLGPCVLIVMRRPPLLIRALVVIGKHLHLFFVRSKMQSGTNLERAEATEHAQNQFELVNESGLHSVRRNAGGSSSDANLYRCTD